MNKKAISPLISPLIGTVLLVAIVIALILLIIPFFTNIVNQKNCEDKDMEWENGECIEKEIFNYEQKII